MNRYENTACPICKKALEKDEDIVVCPECGAPYHRACYKETGHCIFTELHESGESWKPEKPASSQETTEEAADPHEKICPRCGEHNPVDGLFCKTCGTSLDAQNSFPGAQNQPPFPGGNAPFPGGMPFSPFMRGNTVSPDEEIDGIKAQDYATFVGRSAHYFLPRFKELSTSKARIINWGAFFCKGGYFLYRKMYGTGILLFLADILLGLPQIILMMQSASAPALSGTNASPFTATVMICEVLGLLLRFICGFFANTLYKHHCEKHIKKIRNTNITGDEYRAALTKKGGVAVKLVTGLLIGYAALNMISFILLSFLL